jgi:hypothetical protein
MFDRLLNVTDRALCFNLNAIDAHERLESAREPSILGAPALPYWMGGALMEAELKYAGNQVLMRG